MVISGRSVETFEEANYATLSRFKAEGEWKLASTNHKWETFWTELSGWDGETVELVGLDGEFEIREDDRGEFVLLEQEHRGLFMDGTYETRLRPYEEEGTERKPWNPEEEVQRKASVSPTPTGDVDDDEKE